MAFFIINIITIFYLFIIKNSRENQLSFIQFKRITVKIYFSALKASKIQENNLKMKRRRDFDPTHT